MSSRNWTGFVAAAALMVGCVAAGGESGALGGGGSGAADPSGGNGGSGAGVGGGVSGPTDVTLPQLVDGAALANPSVYATIPLRIMTDPPADAVEVDFDGDTVTATAGEGGVFVAELQIGGHPDGEISVVARAALGDESSEAEGIIVIDGDGVQLTVFDTVGTANTPRIHRRDRELWLTWTDRRQGDAEAWLQRIDGAARFIGEPTALVKANGETLSARCVLGSDSVGVLYQAHGGPYTNMFKIVGFDGEEIVAPIPLDGQLYGSFGGDIVFDGEAYVFVWRSNDGAASSTVRWMRVSESGEQIVGPTVVAEAGDDDPHGGFQPSSFISLRHIGGQSVVSFVRDWYHPTLEMSVPKSQVVVIDDAGSVTSSGFLSDETQLTFHREARLFRVGDELVAIWSALDLLDPSQEPPNVMFGARSDGSGAFNILGKGLPVVTAAGDRDEPFVVPHPEHRGVMVWTDNRTGNIDLYAAPLGDDMGLGTERAFAHAVFVASTGQVNAIDLGSNVAIIWRDNRHGFGILDPKPEMWFDTGWY